jgi:hypothetical protein
MFHMISCFNLKPGEDIDSFRSAYAIFVDKMKRVDLVESSGPIGRRQNDTPMVVKTMSIDTDSVDWGPPNLAWANYRI